MTGVHTLRRALGGDHLSRLVDRFAAAARAADRHITITAKSADLQRSAWWVSQRVTLPMSMRTHWTRSSSGGWRGPTAVSSSPRITTPFCRRPVADLMIYAYWTMSARDARGPDGLRAAGPGNAGRGTALRQPLSLWSDPATAGLECAPFVVAHASSAEQSVFDNGLPTGRTEWIRDGTLTALLQTRFSAELTGLTLTPFVDNLGLTVDGARFRRRRRRWPRSCCSPACGTSARSTRRPCCSPGSPAMASTWSRAAKWSARRTTSGSMRAGRAARPLRRCRRDGACVQSGMGRLLSPHRHATAARPGFQHEHRVGGTVSR